MVDLCNDVLSGTKIPAVWRESLLIPLYKGKGDTRECGSYRGVKLLDHGMKILERVLERHIRNIVEIDSMQCGFMPGKGTVDAIYGPYAAGEIQRREEKCVRVFC